MDDQNTQRLRPRPEERFSGPLHHYDLDAVARRLRQEARSSASTHRQESLYKHGATSLALFVFEPHARLAPHKTGGTVVIQVVRGRLTVTADGQRHDLGPGGLLVMAAGVLHDVLAQEESEMLLTVYLEPRTPASA
jgi:quercetin dioxygenase-like cupin family protein